MSRRLRWVLAAALCVLAGWLWLAHGGGKKGTSQAAVAAGLSHDFGFTAAFEEELRKVGQITPDDFLKRFPGPRRVLAKVGWDPTSARFWDRFTLDPTDPKAMTPI